jgi:hypothetical protein
MKSDYEEKKGNREKKKEVVCLCDCWENARGLRT